MTKAPARCRFHGERNRGDGTSRADTVGVKITAANHGIRMFLIEFEVSSAFFMAASKLRRGYTPVIKPLVVIFSDARRSSAAG
jgi:hypothetical protein